MMLRLADYIRNNRGQSLVEFALVLPVLTLLVFGIIDYGRLFNEFLVISHASREGARAGIVSAATLSVVSTAVKSAAPNRTLTIAMNPSTPVRGNPVTVTVSSRLTLLTPVSTLFTQNPFPVTAATTMRAE